MPTQTFRDVSTDSRTLRRGDLFVALRGDRFDGHLFIDQAIKEGALAAVVAQDWYKKNAKKKVDLPLLIVPNTLEAFGSLASLYRRKFNIPVLVIAGSNGKTTTKELIAHVLSTTLEVLKTEANYNNQIGLPRMLFRLRDGHDVAVLEIGTNHPGEIEWLTNVAQPTHALITNIGREHLEFLKDLKGVAKEECRAFEIVKERGGYAFINDDDKILKPFAKQFLDKHMAYGTTSSAEVSAHSLGLAKDGRIELRISAEGKSFRLRTHLVAEYAPNLIACAVAVGLHFKLRRAEIKQAVEHFKPQDKRLELIQISPDLIVLNDCYNANPDSMESALRSLVSFPAHGKKFAVLGDMLELGESSIKEHKYVGKEAATAKLQHVFFIGKAMEAAYKNFVKTAGDTKKASYMHQKDAIVEALTRMTNPGDVILIKGSRGMKMEEIIDALQR